MNKLVFILLSCLICAGLRAQYKVSEIPEALKEGVNAVIRLDEGHFEVKSIRSGVYKAKGIITIMNAKAKSMADVVVGYDRLSKAKITTANVYDANGKQIYKLRKSDIRDQSSISGFSLYEDNRVKYVELQQNEYPYTIEYEYQRDYDFLFFIPSWHVLPRQNVSVERSVYSITAPQGLMPRYRHHNIEENAMSKVESAGKMTYTWTFENVEAIEREYAGPTFRELAPSISVAPSAFEFDGYRGDQSTWDGFARWQNLLQEGRQKLPIETINQMKELVSGIDNDRDKIRAIYEYLQSKTRYVSIQLGIGGFQPFAATEVDELGYGDCKALSNYTRSLLGAVGIDAIYTNVYAGPNPIPLEKEFSRSSFNHIILCVPNKGDTVWLECTNQTNPFGYLGRFTGDRDVLLVTKDGGKIVHTPVYDYKVNVQDRQAQISLDGSGIALASVETNYTGLEYEDDGLNRVLSRGGKDQKDWLLENTGFANFNLIDFSMESLNRPIPEATVKANYELGKYARVSGKRMFFELNPLSRRKYIPPKVENRETDFLQNQTFTERDSIVFTFPERFNFEYLPEGTAFESKFGTYRSEVSRDEGRLIYKREFVLWKKRYASYEYEEFRTFMKEVARADNIKAVVNKTT